MIKNIKQDYRKFYFSLLINLLIFFIYICFFYCRFETNDDYAMKMISSGVYGQDYHLVFINSILGKILSFLYQTLSFYWYEVFLYVILVISFSVSLYIIINTIDKMSLCKTILVMSMIIIYSYVSYVYLTFTNVAGICSASGIISVSFYFMKTSDKKILITGTLLTIIGFMLRFTISIPCIAIATTILIPCIYKKEFTSKGVTKKVLAYYCALFFILLVLYILDIRFYSNEAWKNYYEFNSLRSKLLDHYLPQYSKNYQLYNSIGINENAFSMLKSWNIYDKNVFNVETFKAIKLFDNFKNNICINDIYEIINYLLTNSIIVSLYILLILVIRLINDINSKKINFSILISLFLYFGLLLISYYVRDKRIINHVFYPLSYSFCLVLLYRFDFQINQSLNDIACIISIILFLQISYWQIGDLKYFNSTEINYYNRLLETYHLINDDDDNLYLCETSFELNFVNKLFTIITDRTNILPLGGWQTYSDTIERNLQYYSINNPYADMVNNDNIFILSNNIEQTVAYIKDYYCKDANYILYKEINNVKIYKIVCIE